MGLITLNRIQDLENDILKRTKFWVREIEEIQKETCVNDVKMYYLTHTLNLITDLEDYINKENITVQ